MWSTTAWSKAITWAQQPTCQALELLYMEALVFVHAPDNTSINTWMQWRHTGKNKYHVSIRSIQATQWIFYKCGRNASYSYKQYTPSEFVYCIPLQTKGKNLHFGTLELFTIYHCYYSIFSRMQKFSYARNASHQSTHAWCVAGWWTLEALSDDNLVSRTWKYLQIQFCWEGIPAYK